MCLSALWDVFGRLVSHSSRLTTWPVAWNFMQYFAGIDIDALKRVTVPGLQSDSAANHGFTPHCVYDAMRDHSEDWSSEILGTLKYMKHGNRRELENVKDMQERLEVTIDFWVSFLELYSVEDIKAIREESCSYDNMLQLQKPEIDFLSFPLAMRIPFLLKCRDELGASTGLHSPYPQQKTDLILKVLPLFEKLRGPKVGDRVEVHSLRNATWLNGKRARIIAWQDGTPARCQIEFEDGSEGKAVKAGNLKKI